MKISEQPVNLLNYETVRILHRLSHGPATVRELRDSPFKKKPLTRNGVYVNLSPLVREGYVVRGGVSSHREQYYSLAKPKQDIVMEILKKVIARFFNGSQDEFLNAVNSVFEKRSKS